MEREYNTAVLNCPLKYNIVFLLYKHNDTRYSRDAICRIMLKPRTTVYDSVKALILLGMVDQVTMYKPNQFKGRPVVMYGIDDNFKKYLDGHKETIQKEVIF